jgi:hypothetical protein
MASACRRTQVRSESGLIEDRAIVTAIILMALVNIGGTALLYIEFPCSVPKKMAPGLLVSDDIEPLRLTNRPEMKSCWNVSPNSCSRKSFSCRGLKWRCNSETTRSYCGLSTLLFVPQLQKTVFPIPSEYASLPNHRHTNPAAPSLGPVITSLHCNQTSPNSSYTLGTYSDQSSVDSQTFLPFH